MLGKIAGLFTTPHQQEFNGMPSGVVQVPVFVYPQQIAFYLDDQSTHKHIITLYNPYDFTIRFRVLCTAPNKYTVVDPEGAIRSHNCIDIVVRHNAVSPTNCNITDKFRIQMRNYTTRQVIGKQDVPATLLPGKPIVIATSTNDPEEFQKLPKATASVQQQFGLVRDQRAVPGRIQTPNYIVVTAALICIGALLLPTQGEKESRIPVYLHLTINLKLIFAYVLGLVTMALLRPA
ncbi:hypothetical protein R5R35_010745 [Gryllus longicercus]|uniref:Motile sperm domain-containing protein 3 n=2 Tax=Gryllus longicercus TaxID=2509291 RepID=A0AAN9V5I5_9ORTH